MGKIKKLNNGAGCGASDLLVAAVILDPKNQIEGLNDEDVNKLKKTFYYKYIGKFYTTSDIIKRKLKTNIKKEEGNE